MCSQLVSQNTALLRKRKKNNFGVYIIMLGKAHQMNIGIGTVKNLFNVKIHEWYTPLFKLENLKFFVCQL